jgi:hypothetical protein
VLQLVKQQMPSRPMETGLCNNSNLFVNKSFYKHNNNNNNKSFDKHNNKQQQQTTTTTKY